jgi:hypothetical protein
MKMSKEQEAHLDHIKLNFEQKVDKKYRAGQKEHGGDLIHDNTLSLIDKAIDEAIDQIVYLETIREILVGK